MAASQASSTADAETVLRERARGDGGDTADR
jgi:hypothetical protein